MRTSQSEIAEDNVVNPLECGHEWDDVEELPVGWLIRCSVHGLTRVVNPAAQGCMRTGDTVETIKELHALIQQSPRQMSDGELTDARATFREAFKDFSTEDLACTFAGIGAILADTVEGWGFMQAVIEELNAENRARRGQEALKRIFASCGVKLMDPNQLIEELRERLKPDSDGLSKDQENLASDAS